MILVPPEVFQPAAGKTLVCGSRVYITRKDRRTLYADAIGVDMLAGDGVDYVGDLSEPMFPDGMFAHVDCVSVLEHCAEPWRVAQSLETMLRPGGTILLSVPLVWRLHNYPGDFWRFTPEGVKQLFQRIDWTFCRMYANDRWVNRVPNVTAKTGPMFARCEVVAWGTRKP